MTHRCDFHREGSPTPDHCRRCGHDHASHLPTHLGNGCRPEGDGRDNWGFPTTMVTCRCRGWAVA